MEWFQVGTITLAVLALAVVSAITANGIRTLLASLRSSMDTFRNAAGRDREAFWGEVHRLSERQAHVEGALSIAADRTPLREAP